MRYTNIQPLCHQSHCYLLTITKCCNVALHYFMSHSTALCHTPLLYVSHSPTLCHTYMFQPTLVLRPLYRLYFSKGCASLVWLSSLERDSNRASCLLGGLCGGFCCRRDGCLLGGKKRDRQMSFNFNTSVGGSFPIAYLLFV